VIRPLRRPPDVPLSADINAKVPTPVRIPVLIRLPALVLAACLPLVASAQGTAVPDSQAQITLSFAPVVRQAAPAVVNIYATRIVARRASPFADDPFFRQFFGDLGPAEPRLQNSLGSGVIVSADGIVVSNHHVVGDADDIRVQLADRREFAGRVILSDPEADLAVIRLEGASDLPALAFADSDALAVGDLVLAIGNPFGVGQTVTSGIVSALARAGGLPGGRGGYFIQTDAAINPGNSGGALVDMDGRLVGINTSILTRSGGSNGIGFAIPANLVRQYVTQAERGARELVRPWAGITVQAVDGPLADALGLPLPQGALVTEAHPQSPFAVAGMRPGDVILTVGGQPVTGPEELAFRLSALGTGSTADVVYLRDGAEWPAAVALAPPPQEPAPEVRRVNTGNSLGGLRVARTNPALIEALGLPLSAAGVVVLEVADYARRTGLRPGDILVAINGQPIGTTADVERIAREDWPAWEIEAIRGGTRAVARIRDR
jgi:Do/DeqQ family serine protease